MAACPDADPRPHPPRDPGTDQDRADGAADEVLRLTRALQLLMVAVGHFRSVVADDLAVTANDALALQVLDTFGPMPQIDLGRRLRLTSSSITALVDRLQAAEYVQRRPDPADRRRSIISMTGRAGRTLQDARDTLGRHLPTVLVLDEDLPPALERLAAGLVGIETIHA